MTEELLAAMDAVARAQGKTVDELFEEAGRRLLNHQRLDDLNARGQQHARRLGRKPSDAVELTREIRNEQHKR